jgi:hypothetical protein
MSPPAGDVPVRSSADTMSQSSCAAAEAGLRRGLDRVLPHATERVAERAPSVTKALPASDSAVLSSSRRSEGWPHWIRAPCLTHDESRFRHALAFWPGFELPPPDTAVQPSLECVLHVIGPPGAGSPPVAGYVLPRTDWARGVVDASRSRSMARTLDQSSAPQICDPFSARVEGENGKPAVRLPRYCPRRAVESPTRRRFFLSINSPSIFAVAVQGDCAVPTVYSGSVQSWPFAG